MPLPLERNIPGSPVAVLFVHGIMGTPHHFDFLLPLLPENWSYRCLCLHGHGGDLDDFTASSVYRWEIETRQALEFLGRHDRVLVVTHSMGALLALKAVPRSHVSAIFALAPPLKILPKPRAAVNALKVALDRVRPGDAAGMAAKRCCGVKGDRRLWRYLGSLPHYKDLFALSRAVREKLPAPKVPIEAWFSARDELVSGRSADFLRDREDTSVHFLPNSGHYYYPEEDLAVLCSAFRKFCARYM